MSEPLLPLADEYRTAYDLLCDGGEPDEDLDARFAAFSAAHERLGEAVEQMIRMDKMLRGDVDSAAAAIRDLQEAKSHRANARERLRRYLLMAVQIAGGTVKTAMGTASAKLGPPRVVIDTPDELPDAYYRMTVELDLSKLKAALDQGIVIAGVHLEQITTLAIR